MVGDDAVADASQQAEECGEGNQAIVHDDKAQRDFVEEARQSLANLLARLL